MMNQKSIKIVKNKKGGVPLSIVLIVILTIILLSTSLVLFLSREKQFSNSIYSTSILNDIYVRENMLNYQIQNLIENSLKNANSEEEFIESFKNQLNSYKNLQGVYLNPDLAQIEKQLNERDKTRVSFQNQGDIKIISISFNIYLNNELLDRDKKVFNTEYSYLKNFEAET
ncbi:MAG: hypothetical protein QXI33_00610 [Candidatus Pacearchaeota archaeon]